jgi:hypothetical protein
MRNAIIGALLIAAVSTLGDFVWAGLHLRTCLDSWPCSLRGSGPAEADQVRLKPDTTYSCN